MENQDTRRGHDDSVVSDQGVYTSILDDVLDDSDVGVFVLDPEFSVVWANETIGDYFGIDPAAVRGRDKRSLIEESLREVVDEGDVFAERVLATYDDVDAERFECRVLPGDGRDERHLEHRSHPITDGAYSGGRVELYYDVTTQKENARLETYKSAVEVARDPICVLNLDFQLEVINEAFASLLESDREELLGSHLSRLSDESDFDEQSIDEALEACRRLLASDGRETRTVISDTLDGEEIVFEVCSTLLDHDGEPVGILNIGREITERVGREQALASQRNELETLDRVNSIVRGVNQKLVQATTTDEISQAVCDELSSSDLYRAAVFFEQSRSETVSQPRGGAGVTDDLLQTILEAESPDRQAIPAHHVASTGESMVVPDVVADSTLPDRFRAAASEQNCRSIVTVPVSSGATLFGVLSVYAHRTDAFPDQERVVFEELGETVGNAINAAKQQKLLHSDSILELGLRTSDDRIFVGNTSRAFDCTFRLQGAIPTADDSVIEYISVEGAPVETVMERAEADPTSSAARIVDSNADGGLLEVTLETGSLAKTLLNHGVRLREGVATDGVVHLTVEVAPDTDVRSLTDQLQRDFDGFELVKKEAIDRPVQPVREFRQSIDQSLTEQQRIALRTAYFAGYYDWPRESTGEEVASALDVTSPTFHQHLRRAQQSVFSQLYER